LDLRQFDAAILSCAAGHSVSDVRTAAALPTYGEVTVAGLEILEVAARWSAVRLAAASQIGFTAEAAAVVSGWLFRGASGRRLEVTVRLHAPEPCLGIKLHLSPPMSIDEEALYQEHILDHYEDPYHRGKCPSPTHAHEDDNPLCGDEIRIELQLDPRGSIREAWFEGDGCCISQAAASMLIEHVDGKDVDFVKRFSAEDMLKLFRARLTPNRQKCCLLSWRVLQTALYSPTGGG
jgi:nitrogen fixation protein NifU and related proteins